MERTRHIKKHIGAALVPLIILAVMVLREQKTFQPKSEAPAIPEWNKTPPQKPEVLTFPLWNDGPTGATRAYYNVAAKLPWDRPIGDWRDSTGKAWGSTPYGSFDSSSSMRKQVISVDVTSLVQQWHRGDISNEGFYLTISDGGVVLAINSREAGESPPTLKLQFGGREQVLVAKLDTVLDKSTSKSLGQAHSLKVSQTTPALIWFDLLKLPPGQAVNRATLELYINKTYGNGPFSLDVHRIDPAPGTSKPAPYQQGIANEYPFDAGIERHPSVYFATGFEERNLRKQWLIDGRAGEVGKHSGSARYKALSGRSLAATIPQGQKLGLNIRYRFSENAFPEPEEAYFRYYLRLGDNWKQTVSGGKLPGFAGTYKRAGWGGRRPNGTNGWSTRGTFLQTVPAGILGAEALTPIGNYVYHVDQSGKYGDTWVWSHGLAALLENNRWYCVEQYIRLNTPGKNDGIVRAWLDGRQVFERDDLRFRTSRQLKIQDVWFNIYHGGARLSPQDQTAFIDNVVIAGRYIGPVHQNQKRPQ